MKRLLALLRPALAVTACFLVLFCGIYPLAVWGAGRLLFPEKADGSLITDASGKLRGSRLIGQTFTGTRYFHSRPSALENVDHAASGASNLGPTSPVLADLIRKRIDRYRNINSLPRDLPLPADAVTSSGSGLDPHISPENALLQSRRVAEARKLPIEEVERMIAEHTVPRQLGFLGAARVNVLELNMALEKRTETGYSLK